MDALKAQLERIQQQLSALTSTQKMLVAALVAIMVLTMLYWGKFAENPELVSLLGDQTLETSDIGPIVDRLESTDAKYTVVPGKIMVPADRRAELLAKMMFAHVLPTNLHSAFETMSKTLSPFSSNEERMASYSQATANELSDIIGRFPGVETARVVLNTKSDPRIEGAIHPSATVFITTRGTPENVKGLVKAAADGVASAVSDMLPSRISVIVNRESMKVPDSSAGFSSVELNDQRKAREDELGDKIRNLLRIDGLTVAVNCDVQNRTRDGTDTRFHNLKDGTVNLPEHTTSNSLETETNSPQSREPGVSSNTGSGTNSGASVDTGSPSGGSPNTSKSLQESTDLHGYVGSATDTYHEPAGKDTVVSATVNVPMSYFPMLYKWSKPNAALPDERAMETIRQTEMNRIRDLVKNAIGLKDMTAITVAYYPDPPVDTTLLAAAVTPVSAITTVGGHAKEIGIGLLAIVSLLMMATLVRKSAPSQLVLAGVGAGGMGEIGGLSGGIPTARSVLNSLGSGEDLAGEVGAANSALDGVEMDDESIRSQQVLQQVSTMVKENPDGAAALVKRWLTRP